MRRRISRLAFGGIIAAGLAALACAGVHDRVLICDVASDDPVALLINSETGGATLLSENPQRIGHAGISSEEYHVEFPGSRKMDPVRFRIERFGGKGSLHIGAEPDASMQAHPIRCRGVDGAELL